jgi:hypothetical protein
MSATAIGRERTTRGLVRTLAAGLFALLLALAMTTPAVAEDPEDAEDGFYTGQLDAIHTQENHFDATGVGTPPGEFRFNYFDEDTYHIGHPGGFESDVDMGVWECIAELTIDEEVEHFINIGYQTDDESTFNLNTNVDEEQLEGCGVEVEEEENDEEPPPENDNDADDNDEAEPVERPERVDTGVGGTAATGAAALVVVLLSLGVITGALTLRARASS